VFLKLVLINSAHPQYDVRKKNGFHQNNDESNSLYPQIVDEGQFEVGLLE
jgi:hypothetical protein